MEKTEKGLKTDNTREAAQRQKGKGWPILLLWERRRLAEIHFLMCSFLEQQA